MFHHAVQKQKTHHKHPRGIAFAWLALLIGVGNSSFWTIFPLVLEEAVADERVIGLYFSGMAFIALCASIAGAALFSRFSKVIIMHVSMTLAIVALVAMTFMSHIWHIAGLDIPRAICVLFFTTCLSLFVYDFSTKENLAIDEARYYLFANIGWVIGPIIGGVMAVKYGNQSIFLFASAWFLIALLYFTNLHLVVRHPHVTHEKHPLFLSDMLSGIRGYFSHASLVKVFLVAMGINTWFTVTAIYFPLAIQDMGYGQDVVGLVVTGSMLPLMLFEGLAGKLCKRFGVRPLVIFGFFILGTVAAFYAPLAAWPVLLLFAFAAVNIGAALIEPVQETYYFGAVEKEKADRYFGIYNSADPLSRIIAPLFASVAYSTGGYSAVWTALSMCMFLFMFAGIFIRKKRAIRSK